MARSSRSRTRFSSGCEPVPCSAGSLAMTTLDLDGPVCLSSIPASTNLHCEPSTRAPVASFRNSRRFLMTILMVGCGGRVSGRVELQFRFHAMRQGSQSLRGAGCGLVGNDANEIRAFAEDDALRISNASVAQLHLGGVTRLSRIEDLLRTGSVAHRMHIHYCFQLALVLVVGGRGRDNARLDVLLGVAVDVLPQVLCLKGSRFAGFLPSDDGIRRRKRVDVALLASCARAPGENGNRSNCKHQFI